MPRARGRGQRYRRQYRRRRLGAFFVALGLVVAGAAAFESVRALERTAGPSEGLSPGGEIGRVETRPAAEPISAPKPADLPIARVAYDAVSGELPGAEPGSVGHVQQSVADPSWASARIEAPGRPAGHFYAIFLHKQDERWVAERSVFIEDQPHPKDVKTLLSGIPDDLVEPLFPQEVPPENSGEPADHAVQVLERVTGRDGAWKATETETEGEYHRVRVERESDGTSTHVYLESKSDGLKVVAIGRDLTAAEAPGFPEGLVDPARAAPPAPARFDSTEPVMNGNLDRGRVGKGLAEAREAVEEYNGVAGFYAIDLKSGGGYGVRPDEVFFSASTIKIPVMVAVYRRIDEGKLEYGDQIVTQEEDWAAGAGWLRWETPGAKSTVEDALWLMMTQSDNVATNALTRVVGGPEYVNEVARSLGAEDTRLFWKLSSERAAVPSLDNRTTPRDMARMVREIHAGRAASEFACREMIGLMEQNSLEYWIESGVPQGVKVANKGGWLDATYNDVGLVEYEERPYALAILTKYAPEEMAEGQTVLTNVSKAVWLAQSGETIEGFEKEAAEEARERETREDRERLEEERPEGN